MFNNNIGSEISHYVFHTLNLSLLFIMYIIMFIMLGYMKCFYAGEKAHSFNAININRLI